MRYGDRYGDIRERYEAAVLYHKQLKLRRNSVSARAREVGGTHELWLNTRVGNAGATLQEEVLLEMFERLAPAQQETLISFAEFLTAQPGESDRGRRGEVVPIARPAGETVTMAVRRLFLTYPMLERRMLMAEASELMAQNALEGRDAREVIDELERVFRRHYHRMRKEE